MCMSDDEDDDSDVSQNEMDGPKQACTGTTSSNNSGDGINGGGGAGGHYDGGVAGGGDSGVFPPDQLMNDSRRSALSAQGGATLDTATHTFNPHSSAAGQGDLSANGMIAAASDHTATTPSDSAYAGGGGSAGVTPTSHTSPVPLSDAAQYALATSSSGSGLPPLKWVSVPPPGSSGCSADSAARLVGES